jgi:peptide/nickel transport system substrate-binding protein
MRFALCCALLVGAGALAAGCGSKVTTAEGASDANAGPVKRGGTVTIGEEQEPQCLNMKIACGNMAVADDMYTPMYDPLIGVDDKQQYAPVLATRVPSTANGDVADTPSGGMDVKVSIRPEARWSDLRPITCEDLRFTWKLYMDDRWQIVARTGWELLDDVECVDQRTAIYHFSKPYALFLAMFTLAPLPKHALHGKDFNSYLNERQPVTSGPFLFDHWTRNVEIVLKRNPHYWNAGPDKKPYIDKLRFVFVASTETLKIQLRTGEVDIVNPPPDSTLREELEHTPRIGFQIAPDTTWEHVSYNARKWPTNDVAVRQAISYSIDRQQITDVVLKRQAKVIDSPLLPQQGEYYNPAFAKYKVSNAKARQILEKAGWKRTGTYYSKNGKPLVVTFKSTAANQLRQKVGQLMQQSLKRSGIKAELGFEEPSVFFSQTTLQGNFNMAIWGTTSGLDANLRTLFSCDMIPTKANKYSGSNTDFWCNQHVTDLLKQGEVEPDVAKRQKLYREVQDVLADEAPVLPLFQRPATIAYNEHLHGIHVNPFAGRTWNAKDWWKD